MTLSELSYTLDFNPLSVMCVVNVSSQIEASLFTFFSVFYGQKFLM